MSYPSQTGRLHSGWDQHSLCCSTILFLRKVEDNKWINQTQRIPTDDDNLDKERVEHHYGINDEIISVIDLILVHLKKIFFKKSSSKHY